MKGRAGADPPNSPLTTIAAVAASARRQTLIQASCCFSVVHNIIAFIPSPLKDSRNP